MKIANIIYNEHNDEFHSQQNVMKKAVISNNSMITMGICLLIATTYDNDTTTKITEFSIIELC
jgi:hypothetical protein